MNDIDGTQEVARELKAVWVFPEQLDIRNFTNAIIEPQTGEQIQAQRIMTQWMQIFMWYCADASDDAEKISRKLQRMAQTKQHFSTCLQSKDFI